MKTKITLLAAVLITLIGCGDVGGEEVSLAGTWKFALDPNDEGVQNEWYNTELTGTIRLPGSLQEQGFGNDPDLDTKWTGYIVDSAWYKDPKYSPYREKGNVKVPFWLNPVKHYVGAAWYQKDIYIPQGWKDKVLILNLERTHWQATLYVDDKEVGTDNSLGTPNVFELKDVAPGKHKLTLRVDNRLVVPVGVNAHSVSDHTQSNWNGVIGSIILSAQTKVYVDKVAIFPDVAKKEIKVVTTVVNASGDEAESSFELYTEPFQGGFKSSVVEKNIVFKPGENTITKTMHMGDDILLWDEYTPNMYKLTAKIVGHKIRSTKIETFGMRNFGVDGRRITVNNMPIFLRGTLECCIFPITGYPAMDPDYWVKIYRAVKDHGLNHVRFHSWCPPEAAFSVADTMGVYLQVECGAWTDVGDGGAFDKWLYAESDRILAEYGNHPSFFSLLHGNEPGGRNQVAFLDGLCKYWKQTDGRHLYSSSGGWPFVESADYYNSPNPRIQAWGAGLQSIINAQPPQTAYDFRDKIRAVAMPTISHEIGQWCVYPNFKEIEKYTGVLKAKNFEIFQETLQKNHMGDMSEKFLMASGKLQTLCYKADIEAALRTPEFAGFQLLDLHDFPGQGTALVGVIDPFWESKGYVTPEEYQMFCNGTVPLARMEKLIWKGSDTLKAKIEVSHFAKNVEKNAKVEWRITDKNDKLYKEGSISVDLPLTNCIEVCDIAMPLNEIKEATQLILTVTIPAKNAKNSWNLWVYPQVAVAPENVYVTQSLDSKAIRTLNDGGKVMLALNRGAVKPEKGGDIEVGFSSIFWNTAWTRKQAPHTLGIYCDPASPALAKFPTDYHSDYQWWDVVSACDAMVLDDMPASLRPIVYLVDDWFANRRLGIAFEAKVGTGKLIVTSVDFKTDIENRVAAKQLQASLLGYMNSDRFNPSTDLTLEHIKNILK